MTKFQLEEHLRALLVEDQLLLEECDWEQLNYVRMCIDDTRDQLAKLED